MLTVIIVCISIAAIIFIIGLPLVRYAERAKASELAHTVVILKDYKYIAPRYEDRVAYFDNIADGFIVEYAGDRYKLLPNGTVSSRSENFSHWYPKHDNCVVPFDRDNHKLPEGVKLEEFPEYADNA